MTGTGNGTGLLADQLVEAVPVCGEPVVVELGPGIGPATAAIQHLARRPRVHAMRAAVVEVAA